jgi:hypothetical protein
MGLHKGQTNNPEGRPAGKPNKTTEELRKIFIQFLDKNLANMQTNYNKLDARDKLLFIERMAKLVLPRPLHPLETLSDEQLDEIIQKLKNGEL